MAWKQTLFCMVTSVVFMLLVALTPASARASGAVDIAVVVSLDRSESIDGDEAAAQIDGLIYALNHRRFLNAVASGHHRRIALSVVTWSSFGRHDVILPWHTVAGAEDARTVAAVLRQDFGRERTVTHGTQTDVAMGIEVGAAAMERLPWRAEQRVINMVGDGVSNIGRVAFLDRDAALRRGITINALITAQGSAIRVLSDYFRREVIGGPTAFVQLTNGKEDFAEAMLRKMLLEVARLNEHTRRRTAAANRG
jgi:hypothetical protein